MNQRIICDAIDEKGNVWGRLSFPVDHHIVPEIGTILKVIDVIEG